MVKTTGRYPSRNAADESERKLAAWLRRRRRDAAAGILNPAVSEGLAVLPDWQRLPQDFIHEEKWRKQLAAVVRYRASGHDWPRSRPTLPAEEHKLGVWLRSQRFQLRRGKLSPRRTEALNAALPGWLAGRKTPVTAPRHNEQNTLSGKPRKSECHVTHGFRGGL